jgi:hypothetical protein
MKGNIQSPSEELNGEHDSHEKRAKAMRADISEKLQIKSEEMGSQIAMLSLGTV